MLDCRSWQEAQRVADSLLVKGLVNSAECLDVSDTSGYSVHEAHRDIRLLIDCTEELIGRVNDEINILLNRQPALQEVPVGNDGRIAG